MIAILFDVLLAGLHLWEAHEHNRAVEIKQRYINEVLKLKNDFYAEYNKPHGVRSDAVLSDIDFRLRTLGASFASTIRNAAAGDIPG